MYVAFSVPGLYLSKIRRYQAERPLQVSAVIPPGADQSATTAPGQAPAVLTAQDRGTVTFIDNTVDPTTGTIRLKATFANANRHLWPGAFVQVVLDLTTDPNALVVPAVAVQTSQDGQYVYVVKEDRTVEMRPGHRRSTAGRPGGHCERRQRRGDRRHRRAPAAHAGRPRRRAGRGRAGPGGRAGAGQRAQGGR